MVKYFERYEKIYKEIEDESKIESISTEVLEAHKKLGNDIKNDILIYDRIVRKHTMMNIISTSEWFKLACKYNGRMKYKLCCVQVI